MDGSLFRGKPSYQNNKKEMKSIIIIGYMGAGKTTVLVARLGYMLFCLGILPEEILTVTYTVAATKDMAARCARCAYAQRGRCSCWRSWPRGSRSGSARSARSKGAGKEKVGAQAAACVPSFRLRAGQEIERFAG